MLKFFKALRIFPLRAYNLKELLTRCITGSDCSPGSWPEILCRLPWGQLEKFAVRTWMEEEGTSSAFSSIKFGIENFGMPSFQKTFTDAEAEALAAYVKKEMPADT